MLTFCLLSFVSGAFSALVNSQVDRSITLSSTTVNIQLDLVLKNSKKKGEEGSSEVAEFDILLPASSFQDSLPPASKRLGYLAVKEGEADLKYVKKGYSPEFDADIFRVSLQRPIKPNKSLKLALSYVFGRSYEPLPAKIHLLDEQLMMFTDSLRWISPYPTLKESLMITLPEGERIESESCSLTRYSPTSSVQTGGVSQKQIKWGPFQQIEGFSLESSSKVGSRRSINLGYSPLQDLVMVHFSNRAPQGYFPTVRREIEVSHWGMVSFTEEYLLKNAAAALSSEFSRVPFSMEQFMAPQMGGMQPSQVPHALKSIDAILPRHVRHLHFRDHIGNISSTHARREISKKYTLLQAQPRYPLLGGWQSDWEVSYTLPAKTVIQQSEENPSQFILSVALNQPFVKNFVEEMEITVLLPEGATDVHLNLPRFVRSSTFGVKHSWLDLPWLPGSGRVAIKLSLPGFIIPERDALTHKFQVFYKLSPMAKFWEAGLLCGYVFSLFLAYLLFTRSGLKIQRQEEAKALTSCELDATLLAQIRDFFEDFCHFNDKLLSVADSLVLPKWEEAKSSFQETSLPGFLSRLEGLGKAHSDVESVEKLSSLCKKLGEAVVEVGDFTVKTAGKDDKESKSALSQAEAKASRVQEDCVQNMDKMRENERRRRAMAMGSTDVLRKSKKNN